MGKLGLKLSIKQIQILIYIYTAITTMTENTRISKYTKYNMAHREDRRQHAKQYYHDNKEELLAKVQCNRCNSIVSKMHMHKHQQTLKCKNFNESENKVECDICGSRITLKNLARHKLTPSCQRAKTEKDRINTTTSHNQNKRIINLRNKCIDQNIELLTCDVCGSEVVKDKMFNHKATVGCLTAYFSKVFERPFNKADQMRYDYLMKKRLYFKIKNAERKREAQCASNEN